MSPRLLAQLAWVAAADAEACLPDPYGWPRVEPTPEQLRESDRLRVLAARLLYRARMGGYVDVGLESAFAVFGE